MLIVTYNNIDIECNIRQEEKQIKAIKKKKICLYTYKNNSNYLSSYNFVGNYNVCIVFIYFAQRPVIAPWSIIIVYDS